MSTRMLKNVVLPLVLFPTLTALASKFTLARAPPGSSLVLRVGSECAKQSNSPYALLHTGHPKLDNIACRLVAFFQLTMGDDLGLQFLGYFMGTAAVLAVIPGIEASRSRTNILLAFPLVWLLASQVVTIGVAMTVYGLVFILSGAHQRGTKEQKKITQAHAESVVFAFIIGAVVPTFGLVILKDPQVTALWQIYPLIMSLASAAHLLIRPPSKFAASGWPIIQILLLALFILSSSYHLATVWPLINDPAGIKELLIPSVAPPSTPLGLQTLDFLQWDFVFALGSIILVSFWFTQSVAQFFALLVWYIVMIPVAGPGAALTGIFIWREAQLH